MDIDQYLQKLNQTAQPYSAAVDPREHIDIPGQPAPTPTLDYQSKAAFENFVRAQGGDAAVEQFVSESPEAFLTDAQLSRLDRLGPEVFWDQYYGRTSNKTKKVTPDSTTQNVTTGDTGFSTGGSVNAGTGNVSNVPTNVSLVNTAQDPDTGQVTGYFSDGTSKVLTPGSMSKVEKDAYSLLEDTFKSYGLSELVPVIKGYMEANLGSAQAAIQLKTNDVYLKRFYGNTLRVQAGQNALPESTYLSLENQYNEALIAYGLKGYFGSTRDQQIAGMAQIIGGDISAPEFADRISTAVDRVQNSNPTVKAALQAYYGVTDADLIKYYLNPKEGLASLKMKTTAAEIGAASYDQLGKPGTIGQTRAMELAQMGVTRDLAQKGYKTIGEFLPEAQKLSDIYGEAGIKYTQQQAEQEVFNLSEAASAARKRKQLAALEAAKFSGSAGASTAASSFGSATRGQF